MTGKRKRTRFLLLQCLTPWSLRRPVVESRLPIFWPKQCKSLQSCGLIAFDILCGTQRVYYGVPCLPLRTWICDLNCTELEQAKTWEGTTTPY